MPSAKKSLFSSGQDSISSAYRFQFKSDYHLLVRLSAPEPGGTEWCLEFFAQAAKDPSLLLPLDEVRQDKGHPLAWLACAQKLAQASKLCVFVGEPDGSARALDSEQAYRFIREFALLLRGGGISVQVPKGLDKLMAPPLTLRLRPNQISTIITGSGNSKEKWMSFDYRVALGGAELTLEQFQQIAQSKAHLVEAGGKWVEIDPQQAERLAKELERYRGQLQMGDALRLSLTGASEGVEVEVARDGKNFDSLLSAMGWERCVPASPPDSFIGKLRPYQLRGVGWMSFLHRLGLGALLADDMGLGKTVQVIAYLLQKTKEGQRPHLIVCPTSVIQNWSDEFARFAPSLRVAVHHGSERHGGSKFKSGAQKCDVLITSFSLAWRDFDELSSVPWAVVVLDEAQNIKNPFTKQARSLKTIPARERIALTGTPIENRLADLWSIMDFLNPALLGTWEEFRAAYAKPIEGKSDEQKTKALQTALRPLILRRLKSDRTIISDLPQKSESVEWCPLTPEQATLYQAVVQASMETIEGEVDAGRRKIQILAALTKLKQICNHPANYLQDRTQLDDRSGKVRRLDELLDILISNNESALVFTQYAAMGKLLHGHISRREGTVAHFFHGGLTTQERTRIVQAFAQKNEKPQVLILSLKAGGSGLNLTAACNVIHFDRWWNPAVENQATDRAYRIGQKKNVFVYKLVCRGTVEEKIDKLMEKKQALAQSILGSGEGILGELDGRQLREFLSLGREALEEE